MARFFDRLDDGNQLAKTILYNNNPRDNELFATMIGNFQDGSVPGKMQYGSAWWFLDQIDGMTAQIRALSNMGLFARFVGERLRLLLLAPMAQEAGEGLVRVESRIEGGGRAGLSATRGRRGRISRRSPGSEPGPGAANGLLFHSDHQQDHLYGHNIHRQPDQY